MLRRAAIVLTGLAFLGGATVQALPPNDLLPASAQDPMTVMADCGHMDMQPAQHSGSTKPMPCTGVTPDCLKWMGCIGFPSLPMPLGLAGAPVEYGRVAYWLAAAFSDGVSVEPDLLPPIAA
ncbi:MAG: hypothetical protein HY060_12655 [Proteobacteria bacterium]|nr:hypothetical protein [Pseudomonadota bacterium]